MPGERNFKVGEWWARPRLNELHRGEQVIRIEARSLEVLECLALRAPEVVSKEQILKEVWGEAFVGDEVITHAIWELRRAFEDDAKRPTYIQTVSKKGYRLIAPISWSRGDGLPDVGARIGPYEILDSLGSGTMGVVYKARDTRLDRIVALKFLAPDLTLDEVARKRFQREAKLAAALDHPHLGTLYEIAETHEGRLYLATAFYDGGTLRDRLKEGPLPWSEAVRIVLAVARGLAKMHRHKMIHRDIKPANILLTQDGGVKLVDFGIARWLDATRLTRTGASLGTPAYKSPEQSRGNEVDHRTDIWSLGVVLFEALSGQRPFTAEYEHAVVHAILEEDPPTLEDFAVEVPASLSALLHRTLAKDPEERFQSADELAKALEELLGQSSGEMSSTAEQLSPWAKGGSQNRWRLAFMGLFLLVATALWFGLYRTDPPLTMAERLIRSGSIQDVQGDSLPVLKNAADALEAALEEDPDNAEAHARLGLTYLRIDHQARDPDLEQKGRQHIWKADDLAPDAWFTWFAKAKLMYLLGDYRGAVHAAAEAARKVPQEEGERDLVLALYGESLIETGATEEGLSILKEASEVSSGYIRSRLVLAHRLYRLGRIDEAVREYKGVLKNAPGNFKANNNLGLIYLETEQFSAAHKVLSKAVEVEPLDARLHNNLGIAYYSLGILRDDPEDLELATAAFREAVRIAPDYANGYNSLADALDAQGQLEDSRKALEKSLELYNRQHPASRLRERLRRGVCLARLGRIEEALAVVESFDPTAHPPSEWRFETLQIRALASQKEQVYSLLEDVMEEYDSLLFLELDPALRHFRQDPRVRAISGR